MTSASPARMITAPASSPALGDSPSAIHAAAIPTGGTSRRGPPARRMAAGAACAPRLAQDQPPTGVAIRPIAGEPPCRRLFIACRRGGEEHPALLAVIEALRAVASRVTAGGENLGAASLSPAASG